MPRLTEGLSIEKVVAGDVEELTRLFERLALVLRSYAARYELGEDDTEDFVQEAMISVYQNLHKFDPKREEVFSAWCLTIARNKLAHQMRRESQLLYAPIEVAEGVASAGSDLGPDDLILLEQTISQLPDRQKALVRGIVLEGKSPGEMAEELGISRGAVYTLLHRALRLLRELYLSQRPLADIERTASGGER